MGRHESSRAMLLGLAGLASSIALGSCGGGGDSSAPPPPAPTPTPAPPPPSPPSVDGTKISLTRLSAPCITATECLLFESVLIDTAGEATVVWGEAPPVGTSRLVASNFSLTSKSQLSTVVVESAFALPRVRAFQVRPLGARRFAVFHNYGVNGNPDPEPMHARIVVLGAAGAATVAPQVTLPPFFQAAPGPFVLVQDATQQMYSLLIGLVSTGPPFPGASLGNGAELRGYAIASSPFSSFAGDFYTSNVTEPWALYSGLAVPSPVNPSEAYVSRFNLLTGETESPVKVASGVRQVSPQLNCADQPNFPTQATGPSTFSVGWRQLSSTANGCDLFVDGQKLNADAKTVTTWGFSATATEVVVVWSERDSGPTSPRVYWRRRAAATGVWTAAAAIAPQYPSQVAEQSLLVTATGPGGVLAALWSNAAAGSGSAAALVSKYVNGTWTTVSGGTVKGVRGAAINGQGDGIALFRNELCDGAACEELFAVRF